MSDKSPRANYTEEITQTAVIRLWRKLEELLQTFKLIDLIIAKYVSACSIDVADSSTFSRLKQFKLRQLRRLSTKKIKQLNNYIPFNENLIDLDIRRLG